MNKDVKFKESFNFKYPAFLVVLFLSFLMQSGCSSLELESAWRDREIVVDGKGDDWLGAKYYFEDVNISLGLLNDDRFLYVCMDVENPMLRAQIMRQGLTLWLDPKGGKEKSFGIRFPLGRQGSGRLTRESMDEQNREEMIERFEQSLTDLEILGPGKNEIKKMAVEEATGIEIKLEASTRWLVYELKIPLIPTEEHPYAIGTKAGDSIGIGLEAPEIDMSAMRDRLGGGMGGGGRMPGEGGRGGMGGGPGGMGMRGGGRQMPSELKV
ncbi:MAG: hypothetical protein OEZ52_11255, partial [Candidatus Aminicenantes bacterium]|nr:hypothetical protein [Candidatus Aminicenantes bacterium]